MSLKIDLRVPVGLPVVETAAFIQRCEAAGFSGVGVHDHQHSGRDVFLTLGLAAERTSHLALYPATANPVTRHPMVLASLAHTLEEIAPGRTNLTLAPGFLSVGAIGRPRATIEEMRRAVIAIRGLLAGEKVFFRGTESQLRNISDSPPPIYMTAAGPRMIELAGEVADGVLMFVGLDPRSVTEARRHLAIGARRVGRDLKDFAIILITPFALDYIKGDSLLWPQRWFSPGHPWITYPSVANLFWLEQAGIKVPLNVLPEQVSDSDARRICDAFGLFGSPEESAARLQRAAEETGINHFFLFPAHTKETGYEMPERELEAFHRVLRHRL